MAVTNLGGGGYLQNVDPSATNIVNQLASFNQQQQGIRANQMADQKQVSDAIAVKDMEEATNQYPGASQGYAIRQNYDRFLRNTTQLMGGDIDGAKAYLDQIIATDSTPEQLGWENQFDAFKADVDKKKHILDYDVEERRRIQDKTTGEAQKVDLTVTPESIISYMQKNPGMDVRNVISSMIGSTYDEFTSGEAGKSNLQQDLNMRKILAQGAGIEGYFNETKGPDGQPIGVTAAMNQALTEALRAGNFDLANLSTQQASELEKITGGKDQNGIFQINEDSPYAREAMAASYNMRAGDTTGVIPPEMLPPEQATKPNTAQDQARMLRELRDRGAEVTQEGINPADRETMDALHWRATSGDSVATATSALPAEVQKQLSFSIGETTKEEAYAIDQVMKDGWLTKFQSFAQMAAEQGGAAAAPFAYEMILKQVQDKTGVEAEQARTALNVANTQAIYSQLNSTGAEELDKLRAEDRTIVDAGNRMLEELGAIFEINPDGSTAGVAFKDNTLFANDSKRWNEIYEVGNRMNAIYDANPQITTQPFLLEVNAGKYKGKSVVIQVPSAYARGTVGTRAQSGGTTSQVDVNSYVQ